MEIPTFEGIMSVVATPFARDGSIAFDVLGKHLDFLIANGVHYIIPGGTTGEYYAQTVEERKKVLDLRRRAGRQEGPPRGRHEFRASR